MEFDTEGSTDGRLKAINVTGPDFSSPKVCFWKRGERQLCAEKACCS